MRDTVWHHLRSTCGSWSCIEDIDHCSYNSHHCIQRKSPPKNRNSTHCHNPNINYSLRDNNLLYIADNELNQCILNSSQDNPDTYCREGKTHPNMMNRCMNLAYWDWSRIADNYPSILCQCSNFDQEPPNPHRSDTVNLESQNMFYNLGNKNMCIHLQPAGLPGCNLSIHNLKVKQGVDLIQTFTAEKLLRDSNIPFISLDNFARGKIENLV